VRLFTEGLDVPFPTHQKYKDSYLVDRACEQGLNMLRDPRSGGGRSWHETLPAFQETRRYCSHHHTFL